MSGTVDKISAIKNQLRAEHTATWGDVLIPDGLVAGGRPGSEQNRSGLPFAYNETAIAEADAIEWQWGFWPFTRIETVAS